MHHRRLFRECVAALLLVLLFAASSEAAAKQVLLLHSSETVSITSKEAASLRANLNRDRVEPVNFFEFVLNPFGFTDPSDEGDLAFLTSSFADRSNLDLIVTFGGPAAAFVRRYGRQVFSDTPVVFAGLDRLWLQDTPLAKNEAAVTAANDFPRLVDEILLLLPQTSNLFIVMGAGQLEQFWHGVLQNELARFNGRLALMWSDGLSLEATMQRAATLPPHTAIVVLTVGADALGTYSEERIFPLLHAAANAPLFSGSARAIGMGIIGGTMMSTEELGGRASDVAARILNGESPGAIKMPTQLPDSPIFDWRELQRWGISEKRLPPGSRVLFKEPTMWDRYKAYILGAVVIVLAQSLLIMGLVVQRARRQHAENQVRRSYKRIRQLAARLITAQDTERSRIARELHDDISQQVSALAMDLAHLRGTGDHESERRADTAFQRADRVASSLRDLAHQLHPARLRFLGLVGSVEGLRKELSHSGIPITFTHENVPSTLSPDLTVCLFRVVQETLQNALKYSNAHEVTVHLSGRPDGLTLLIADDGIGFDVDAAWGNGLGLVSVRERVEAVGGSFEIRSAPGAGTRFKITVPVEVVQAARETVAS